MRRLFLLVTLVSILILVILHYGALIYDLYGTFFWFDMLTHTLGGFVVVFVGIVFLGSRSSRLLTRRNLIILVIGIGVLWELYEYLVQTMIPATPFVTFVDSLSDILFDVVGGVIGICFVHWLKKRYTTRDGN